MKRTLLQSILLGAMMLLTLPAWAETYTVKFTNDFAWGQVYAWIWNNQGDNLSSAWPGEEMLPDGTGRYVLTFTWDNEPAYIIFSDGVGTQTPDLEFVNNGVYNIDGLVEVEDGWTILPTNCWAFEWRDGERVEGPALTDENGDYKIYVRGGAGLESWDSQFHITFGEENALKIGDVMSVTFKVKADAPATFGTQSHTAPGAYLYWSCIGDVDATTSWEETTRVVTVTEEEMKGTYTIAFNLSDGQENNVYFKDIEVKVQKATVIDSWTDIIVNGDMEGESNECFYVTEQGIGGPFLANLTEGIGVDGSRAVKVESYDNPSADWDTQFFIRLPYQIPAGTKFKVSFDYKADRVGDFDTMSHTEPGGYIHYACVGSGTFTTEWKHFEAEGTVSSDMSKEGQLFQTIAFNLAKNKERTNFIFDNVKFEVPTEVLATLTKNPAVDPKPYTRPVYSSMAIVGDFLGLEADANWEPTNGWEMEQDAENPAVWTLTKDFVAEAKTYEYKATANGKWGDYELPYVGNAEFNFDDPNLGAGAYSLTFTVDTRLHALNLDVHKLGVKTYTASFTTNADYWTDVYAYAWSGEEPNVTKFLGDWPGTKLKADAAGVYTVSIEATDAPEKIIFNNGNSGEGNQTADLPFVNGAAYEFKAASGEEDPIKEAPAGWTNAVTNGNLAGDDVSSFVAKEYPAVDFSPAAIVAGAGTNGSRGILVKTADETEVSDASDWDSQFFIVLPEALPEGTKIHVEFDYKASENATAGTQSHGNPGAYQHWAGIGDVNFTTEWQTFSIDIEVDASMAKGDFGNGSGTGLKSICFNLAVNKNAVEYHFDNFGIWYQKPDVTPEYFVDFEAGPYYIIDYETGLGMAAGGSWGVHGIVNDLGLDLILTPNKESRSVTIDSRVSNGGNSHFLGNNLYMDQPEFGWYLDYQGFGFYITDGSKYINLDEDNNLVLSDTPREWIIVSAEGVKNELLDEMSLATIDNPVDATLLITAQNFNCNDLRNAEAWSVSGACNLSTGKAENRCAESLHSTFTVSQAIAGAPKGTYQLTAQGFYRQDDGYTEDAPVFFIGDATGQLPMQAGSETSASNASDSFTNGLYTIAPITFYYDGTGDLTIGIKGTAEHQWVVFDNFCLTYLGTKKMVETDPQVYTEFAEATGTLTYYYDGKINFRSGVTEVYDPNATRFNGYKNDVQMAVIDPSMKEAPLTSTKEMFYDLRFMTSIEGLENLNTSGVTNMEGMFENCTRLEILDLTSFDISNVTNFMLMFSQCTHLSTICCFGDWSTSSAQSGYMFYGCRALRGGEGTAYSDAHTDKSYARPDGGTGAPGYFTAETITSIEVIHNSQFTIHNEEEAAYNLAGQRLSKPTKGINIIGGKKVAIK